MAIRTGGLLSCASKARVAAKKIPKTAERAMFINGLMFGRHRRVFVENPSKKRNRICLSRVIPAYEQPGLRSPKTLSPTPTRGQHYFAPIIVLGFASGRMPVER